MEKTAFASVKDFAEQLNAFEIKHKEDIGDIYFLNDYEVLPNPVDEIIAAVEAFDTDYLVDELEDLKAYLECYENITYNADIEFIETALAYINSIETP